jgi:aconitate hydratase
MLIPPREDDTHAIELIKGPNIESLPELIAFPEDLELPILLKVGDDISTDEILPGGERVLPYRSNIPKISEFTYEIIDPTYAKRAMEQKKQSGHVIIGGENYGQGSSREHAALAPRYLGLRLVIAKTFARIHSSNLVNYGILPVTFNDPLVYDLLEVGDVLTLKRVREQLANNSHDQRLEIGVPAKDFVFAVNHNLTKRMIEVLFSGGLTNWIRDQVRLG